jgi:AraC-like DNA-binding protein
MDGSSRVESIRFLRPPELHGAEALWADHCGRKWRVFHETYTVSIGLELQGPEFEWTYRRRLYRSAARKMMLMEPGELHANTRATAPASFRVLFMPADVVEAAAKELGFTGTPHVRSGYCADAALFDVFRRLHASLDDEVTTLERQSRLTTCIRLFLEHCTDAPAVPRGGAPGIAPLVRARDFIGDHLEENVSLDDVAAAAGWSRFHLVRAFRGAFGIPPHAYQLQLRVARARRLLAAGQSAAATAAQLGFVDQSHLNRRFKQSLGVTAVQYQSPRAISY